MTYQQWWTANFLLQYQPIVKQISDENKDRNHQQGKVVLFDVLPNSRPLLSRKSLVIPKTRELILKFSYLLVHFSLRVLCETVKDFVSKVGSASASSDPSEADDPDSLPQKVSTSVEHHLFYLPHSAADVEFCHVHSWKSFVSEFKVNHTFVKETTKLCSSKVAEHRNITTKRLR